MNWKGSWTGDREKSNAELCWGLDEKLGGPGLSPRRGKETGVQHVKWIERGNGLELEGEGGGVFIMVSHGIARSLGDWADDSVIMRKKQLSL